MIDGVRYCTDRPKAAEAVSSGRTEKPDALKKENGYNLAESLRKRFLCEGCC